MRNLFDDLLLRIRRLERQHPAHRLASRLLPVTHPLYSAVYHSHPPLLERLRAMRVLARLAEMDVLRSVEVLSTVSGGSIVGAHYYLEVKKRRMGHLLSSV